ncbi:MAG: hypothetical protein GXX96_23965 [Planctomycetaceae bacterium]|nr:hypothetical protein [Planctomycetaceae bacterium]
MARHRREAFEGLSELSRARPDRHHDYLENSIRVAAAYNHALVFLYSLLAAADLALLLLTELSPWAGAALTISWGLFVFGLGYTSVGVYVARRPGDVVDSFTSGDAMDEALDENGVMPDPSQRTTLLEKEVRASDSQRLFLGMLAAGVSVGIDHWGYVWRALAIAAGIAAVLFLVSLVMILFRGEESNADSDDNSSNAG